MKLYNWEQLPAEQMNAHDRPQGRPHEQMTIARLNIQKGAVVPEHAHINEQVANVEQGSLKFHIGGEDLVVSAGESLVIPPNVPHGVVALEDYVVTDVFTPRRDDWIKGDDSYLRALTQLAAAFEELAQQFDALDREHALDDFDAVIEHVRIGDLEFAAHAAEAQVARAEDHARDARRHQRSGAHHARLQRAIQRGAGQAVVAERGERPRGWRESPRARSDRAERDRCVGAAPDHLADSPRRRPPAPRRRRLRPGPGRAPPA